MSLPRLGDGGGLCVSFSPLWIATSRSRWFLAACSMKNHDEHEPPSAEEETGSQIERTMSLFKMRRTMKKFPEYGVDPRYDERKTPPPQTTDSLSTPDAQWPNFPSSWQLIRSRCGVTDSWCGDIPRSLHTSITHRSPWVPFEMGHPRLANIHYIQPQSRSMCPNGVSCKMQRGRGGEGEGHRPVSEARTWGEKDDQ
ncbi:hypothetical protein VTO42DRAFT_7107 [Malbranchea cinnamomea]